MIRRKTFVAVWKALFIWLVIMVVALAGVLVVGRCPTAMPDDAFITFRYARNLAEGHGFVYNPGEKVLGTTSPLWALILGGIHWLFPGIDLPMVARALSALFYGLVGLIVFALARRWLSKLVSVTRSWALGLAFLASTLWLLSPQALGSSACTGMETAFFTFLLILSAYMYDKGRGVLAGVVLGVSVVTRIDAAVAVACFVLWSFLLRRKSLLPVCIGVLVISLPWFLFSYLYFGSLIPNTLVAKSVLYADSEWSWTRSQMLFTILGGRLGAFLWGLASVSLVLMVLKRFPTWFALYPLAYATSLVMFVSCPPGWYFVPFWPSVILTATLGVAAILRLSRTTATGKVATWLSGLLPSWRTYSTLLGYGLILVIIVSLCVRTMNTARIVFEQHGSSATHVGGPGGIGDYLSRYPTDKMVFIGDIGAVGWLSNLRVYDFAGLVTPDAIGYNRERKNYDGRLNISASGLLTQIRNVRPDFVVLATYMPFVEEVTTSSTFRKCYEEVLRSGGHILWQRVCE